MYIEEIASKEDYLLQLSSLETDTGRRADFDVTLNHDNATREKPKFINPDRVLDKGKISFGRYTFFISEAPDKTDCMAAVVASTKNE